MENNKIEIIYLKKISEFQKHNKLYYQKSAPVISDKDFDDLKN